MLTKKTKVTCSFFLSFLLICMTTSCIEEPPFLDSTQLKLVDTLVKHQILPLRLEIDSLCDLRFEEEVEKVRTGEDPVAVHAARHDLSGMRLKAPHSHVEMVCIVENRELGVLGGGRPEPVDHRR